MLERWYGIFNIEASHFSLTDEDFVVYCASILYTNNHTAYYAVKLNWFRYIIFKLKFWWMREYGRSKLTIRKIHYPFV